MEAVSLPCSRTVAIEGLVGNPRVSTFANKFQNRLVAHRLHWGGEVGAAEPDTLVPSGAVWFQQRTKTQSVQVFTSVAHTSLRHWAWVHIIGSFCASRGLFESVHKVHTNVPVIWRSADGPTCSSSCTSRRTAYDSGIYLRTGVRLDARTHTHTKQLPHDGALAPRRHQPEPGVWRRQDYNHAARSVPMPSVAA